jgi:DNA polymerase I-like protein with 3'-5' exonuclease and polymerase domains
MFLVPVVSVGGQLGTNHRGKEYPTHERIVKIEIDPTPMWVRDLTVQEDHSFVANGLITHNCYGMSAEKLVLYALANYKVKLSLREAQRFRQRYFEAYSGVAAWHRRALDEGKRTRITRSIANRLRYLDENAHNEILNTPVQATGADILKTALREVYIRLKRLCGISGPLCRTVVAPLPKVMVVHHVHDELIEEYDLSDSEFGKAVGDATKEGMEAAGRRYLRNIPVIADPGQGESWADK